MEPTSIVTASSLPTIDGPALVQAASVNLPTGAVELILHMLAFCLVVALVTEGVVRLLLLKFTKKQLYTFEKLIPIVIGALLSPLPSAVPALPNAPIPPIFLGIIAGGFCGQIYGIAKRVLYKQGEALTGGRK